MDALLGSVLYSLPENKDSLTQKKEEIVVDDAADEAHPPTRKSLRDSAFGLDVDPQLNTRVRHRKQF